MERPRHTRNNTPRNQRQRHQHRKPPEGGEGALADFLSRRSAQHDWDGFDGPPIVLCSGSGCNPPALQPPANPQSIVINSIIIIIVNHRRHSHVCPRSSCHALHTLSQQALMETHHLPTRNSPSASRCVICPFVSLSLSVDPHYPYLRAAALDGCLGVEYIGLRRCYLPRCEGCANHLRLRVCPPEER